MLDLFFKAVCFKNTQNLRNALNQQLKLEPKTSQTNLVHILDQFKTNLTETDYIEARQAITRYCHSRFIATFFTKLDKEVLRQIYTLTRVEYEKLEKTESKVAPSLKSTVDLIKQTQLQHSLEQEVDPNDLLKTIDSFYGKIPASSFMNGQTAVLSYLNFLTLRQHLAAIPNLSHKIQKKIHQLLDLHDWSKKPNLDLLKSFLQSFKHPKSQQVLEALKRFVNSEDFYTLHRYQTHKMTIRGWQLWSSIKPTTTFTALNTILDDAIRGHAKQSRKANSILQTLQIIPPTLKKLASSPLTWLTAFPVLTAAATPLLRGQSSTGMAITNSPSSALPNSVERNLFAVSSAALTNTLHHRALLSTVRNEDFTIAGSPSDNSNEIYSRSIPLPDGSFIVIYVGDNGVITGQRIDRDGNLQGSSFTIASSAYSSFVRQPKTATLSNGDFIVAWTRYTAGGIFYATFKLDGTVTIQPTQISPSGLSRLELFDLTALSDGGFAAIWQDESGKVFITRYRENHTQFEAEVALSSAGLFSHPSYGAALTSLANGNYAAFWTEGADGNNKNLYGAYIDSSNRLIKRFTVMNNGVYVNVTPLPSRNFMVIWHHQNWHYQQEYTNTCEPLSEPILIQDSNYNYRRITHRSNDGYLAALMGNQESNSNAFLQRYSTNWACVGNLIPISQIIGGFDRLSLSYSNGRALTTFAIRIGNPPGYYNILGHMFDLNPTIVSSRSIINMQADDRMLFIDNGIFVQTQAGANFTRFEISLVNSTLQDRLSLNNLFGSDITISPYNTTSRTLTIQGMRSAADYSLQLRNLALQLGGDLSFARTLGVTVLGYDGFTTTNQANYLFNFPGNGVIPAGSSSTGNGASDETNNSGTNNQPKQLASEYILLIGISVGLGGAMLVICVYHLLYRRRLNQLPESKPHIPAIVVPEVKESTQETYERFRLLQDPQSHFYNSLKEELMWHFVDAIRLTSKNGSLTANKKQLAIEGIGGVLGSVFNLFAKGVSFTIGKFRIKGYQKLIETLRSQVIDESRLVETSGLIDALAFILTTKLTFSHNDLQITAKKIVEKICSKLKHKANKAEDNLNKLFGALPAIGMSCDDFKELLKQVLIVIEKSADKKQINYELDDILLRLKKVETESAAARQTAEQANQRAQHAEIKSEEAIQNVAQLNKQTTENTKEIEQMQQQASHQKKTSEQLQQDQAILAQALHLTKEELQQLQAKHLRLSTHVMLTTLGPNVPPQYFADVSSIRPSIFIPAQQSRDTARDVPLEHVSPDLPIYVP